MSHSKVIPEYAKDFEKEWLCIRGINKECGWFIGRLHNDEDLFNSPQANHLRKFIRKILRAEERGKIKVISSLIFEYFDVNNMDCLEEQLGDYSDLYVKKDGSYEFDQERYDLCIDIDYPGYKEFFELICLLNDKIKSEELTINLPNSDSDSDSDNDSDSDSDSDPGFKEFFEFISLLNKK